MTAPYDLVVSRLDGVKKNGNEVMARCPAHEDRTPSLSISEGREGRVLLHCHAGCSVDAVLAGMNLTKADLFNGTSNGNGSKSEIVATYDYVDEDGVLLFQAVRFFPKDFRQRIPDGRGGWDWKLGKTRRVLYRLPAIIEAVALDKTIYVVEGEKDVAAIESIGGVATCNPMGAGKWRDSYSDALRGAVVRIVADRDEAGRKHAHTVATALEGVAESVELLQPRTGNDPSDHIEAGHGIDDFDALADVTGPRTPVSNPPEPCGVTLADFRAYMPEHKYIFTPARELWPAASVNARLGKVGDGDDAVKANLWLDQNQAVEQMTWAPGEPMLIQDRLFAHGGWIDRPGCACFNLYRAPTIESGDADRAGPWVDHVHRVYPTEAQHIIAWLAHRRQKPNEKINHALVLGGLQGIGKDTILEPVKHAIGPWNCQEVSPAHLLGRFNGFVKSVILRISEARDLGDMDRYAFYEHMKAYAAAPPDVLRCDEKNIREYSVLNVCGLIITTNHKADGIFLPADDRRHFVAWSELTKDDFEGDYWRRLYGWYEAGGNGHVTAYLDQYDLSDFDAKAPPPKTAAFWDIVDANRAPEDAELADVLDRLMSPRAVTLHDLADRAEPAFGEWLRDRRNSRKIPHRLEAAGYVPVRNDAAKSGLWVVGGKRQVVYAQRELSVRERIAIVSELVERSRT